MFEEISTELKNIQSFIEKLKNRSSTWMLKNREYIITYKGRSWWRHTNIVILVSARGLTSTTVQAWSSSAPGTTWWRNRGRSVSNPSKVETADSVIFMT